MRYKAFTLAELLITLGTIGVIASLTLPQLIANHQKKVFITQLQKTYSVLANTILRAQADYGDISMWKLDEYYNHSYISGSEMRLFAYPYFEKYIVPYVQNIKFKNQTKLNEIGYREGIKRINGSVFAPPSGNILALILNDGSLIFPMTIVKMNPETGETLKGDNGESYIMGLFLIIDVNGAKGPNTLGKDVFFTQLPFTTDSKLAMYQPFRALPNKIFYDNVSRETLINECKSTGYYCGYLIQRDGWQIKNDYPW